MERRFQNLRWEELGHRTSSDWLLPGPVPGGQEGDTCELRARREGANQFTHFHDILESLVSGWIGPRVMPALPWTALT